MVSLPGIFVHTFLSYNIGTKNVVRNYGEQDGATDHAGGGAFFCNSCWEKFDTADTAGALADEIPQPSPRPSYPAIVRKGISDQWLHGLIKCSYVWHQHTATHNAKQIRPGQIILFDYMVLIWYSCRSCTGVNQLSGV